MNHAKAVPAAPGRPVSGDSDAALDELVTARDLIRWGASRFNEAGLFFGHGTEGAVADAVALVLGALHLDPDTPDALLSSRLTRDERRAVLALLERRIEERRPAAYLTGRAWFAGLPFAVDERVLVPRSPIAELVEQGFSPWLDGVEVRRVLDLGTGSGCIAAACAMTFPEAAVEAVDVSPDALAVARANLRDLGLADRVRVFESNLFSAVSGSYDLIVSNPPYVAAGELDALPAEYRYEPRVGLAGGEDGLALVREILAAARDHLDQHGVLVVEVGSSRPALVREFAGTPFLWLEFERGGDDVFLLTAEQLEAR